MTEKVEISQYELNALVDIGKLDKSMEFIQKALENMQKSLWGVEKRQENFDSKLNLIEERLKNMQGNMSNLQAKQATDISEIRELQQERTLSGFLSKHGKAVKWGLSIITSGIFLFIAYEKFKSVL